MVLRVAAVMWCTIVGIAAQVVLQIVTANVTASSKNSASTLEMNNTAIH